VRLIHVTDRRNLPSITERGLDPAYATGKRSAVWAVAPKNESWAILHTLSKPRAAGRTVADHVVLVVDVPRSWLRRHAAGVWWCDRVIPTERIAVIREAADTAAQYPI